MPLATYVEDELAELGLHPVDPELIDATSRMPASLRHRVHRYVLARQSLGQLVDGVRLQAIVRWDSWTTTFEGLRVADGRLVLFRRLGEHLRSDPFYERELGKIRTQMLLPGTELTEGMTVTARALAGAISSLIRLGQSPAPQEIRVVGERVHICSLAARGDDLSGAVRALLMVAELDGDGPLDRLFRGFRAFPPSSGSELRQRVQRAAAETLAGELMQLRARRLAMRTKDARGRLERAMGTLQRSAIRLPPLQLTSMNGEQLVFTPDSWPRDLSWLAARLDAISPTRRSRTERAWNRWLHARQKLQGV